MITTQEPEWTDDADRVVDVSDIWAEIDQESDGVAVDAYLTIDQQLRLIGEEYHYTETAAVLIGLRLQDTVDSDATYYSRADAIDLLGPARVWDIERHEMEER